MRYGPPAVLIASSIFTLVAPSQATTCLKEEQRRAPVKAVCGDVRDPYDSALPGAEISLIREDGSVFKSVKTDSGKFAFSLVPKGDYVLRIEARGFPQEERKITVTRDRVTRCKPIIRAKLSPVGGCRSSIRVKGVDKR